ncbi:MAG: hypothetical protein HC906_14555 [Bacteroidales bacterium]|nr:hypothetical protein [Bacteroidales bacterium]
MALHYISGQKYRCNVFENDSIRFEAILEPVYRQKMLKQYDSQDTVNFTILLGKLPPGLDEPYELNVLILKNNLIYDVIPVTHICSDHHDVDINLPLIIPSYENYTYIPSQQYDSLPVSLTRKAVAEYNDLFQYLSGIYQYVNNEKITGKIIGRLDSIQHFLFNLVLDKKMNYEVINPLPVLIPENYVEPSRKFYRLFYNKLLFNYLHIPNSVSDSVFIEALKTIKNSEDPVPEAVYNFYSMDKKLGKTELDYKNVKQLKLECEIVNEFADTGYLRALKAFYAIQALSFRMDSTANLLEDIYRYYSRYKVAVSERLQVVRLFIYYRRFYYAYLVLVPALDNEFQNKEAYILELMLYYSGKMDQLDYKRLLP